MLRVAPSYASAILALVQAERMLLDCVRSELIVAGYCNLNGRVACSALLALKDGPRSTGEVSQTLRSSGAQRALQQLCRSGYAENIQASHDARVTMYELTTAGQEAALRAERVLHEYLQEAGADADQLYVHCREILAALLGSP